MSEVGVVWAFTQQNVAGRGSWRQAVDQSEAPPSDTEACQRTYPNFFCSFLIRFVINLARYLIHLKYILQECNTESHVVRKWFIPHMGIIIN